jgi:hypothetical protein
MLDTQNQALVTIACVALVWYTLMSSYLHPTLGGKYILIWP